MRIHQKKKIQQNLCLLNIVPLEKKYFQYTRQLFSKCLSRNFLNQHLIFEEHVHEFLLFLKPFSINTNYINITPHIFPINTVGYPKFKRQTFRKNQIDQKSRNDCYFCIIFKSCRADTEVISVCE